MSLASASAPSAAALDELCINTLRFLSVDAVQKANSGHPGLPLGAAPMAYVLWTRFLKHHPAQSALARPRSLRAFGRARLDAALQPAAPDRLRPAARRDQAVPPVGQHARRAIPSAAHTPGVEVTTGPLGQGFGNAVGMAIAEAHLAARYNRAGLRGHRPPHLRDRQRRRPDGRRRLGGGLARRPPAARQADLPLRRQPRHAFRRHRHHVHRGSRAALRGLRLAHAVGRRRQRPRRDRRARCAPRAPRRRGRR